LGGLPLGTVSGETTPDDDDAQDFAFMDSHGTGSGSPSLSRAYQKESVRRAVLVDGERAALTDA
jgi:hypothetical protein